MVILSSLQSWHMFCIIGDITDDKSCRISHLLKILFAACSGSDGVQRKVSLEVAGEIKVVCQSK